MAEVKGKILCKKGDNKAFKLDDDNWYNCEDNVVDVLKSLNKDDVITATYEKKGVSRYVSQIISGTAPSKAPAASTTASGVKKCACGAEIKDPKYNQCYKCSQAKKDNANTAPKAESTTTEKKLCKCGAEIKNTKYDLCFKCSKAAFKKGGKGSSNSFYGSEADIAGKEAGCALGAAGAAASGKQFLDKDGQEDPTTAAEWIKIVASSLLEWIRANK